MQSFQFYMQSFLLLCGQLRCPSILVKPGIERLEMKTAYSSFPILKFS